MDRFIDRIESEEELDEFIENFKNREIYLDVGDLELEIQVGSLSDDGVILDIFKDKKVKELDETEQ